MSPVPATFGGGSLDRAQRDVFIVGAPRSGTTWLRAVLSNHPSFASPPETYVFADLATAQARYATPEAKVGMQTTLPQREFHRWCGELWSEIRTNLVAARPGASRVLEKTPMHAQQMPLIRSVVPGALFIHIVRNPMDVTKSLLHASAGWGADWAPTCVEGACDMWNQNVGMALSSARADDTILVRYDELTEDPKHWKRLLSFVGIPVSWTMPDVTQDPNTIRVNTRYKIDTDGYETDDESNFVPGFSFHTRSKSELTELTAFERRYVAWACQDLMRTLGYQPTQRVLNPVDRFRVQARGAVRVFRRKRRQQVELTTTQTTTVATPVTANHP